MKLALQNLVMTLCLALLIDTAHLSVARGSATAQELPSEEAGKNVTEQVCSACHGVDVFAGKRQTREMWRLTVEDMFGRGAVGTQEQFDQIVSYLAAYRGVTINVNEAEAQVLGQVLDIPRIQAQAIVDFRTANGKFESLEDLQKIPGLDPARLEEQRLNLSFN
jgi:competence protein ComEA